MMMRSPSWVRSVPRPGIYLLSVKGNMPPNQIKSYTHGHMCFSSPCWPGHLGTPIHRTSHDTPRAPLDLVSISLLDFKYVSDHLHAKRKIRSSNPLFIYIIRKNPPFIYAEPTVLPPQSGILTPSLRLRSTSIRPQWSSQFWEPELYMIFHGSSKLSNQK